MILFKQRHRVYRTQADVDLVALLTIKLCVMPHWNAGFLAWPAATNYSLVIPKLHFLTHVLIALPPLPMSNLFSSPISALPLEEFPTCQRTSCLLNQPSIAKVSEIDHGIAEIIQQSADRHLRIVIIC